MEAVKCTTNRTVHVWLETFYKLLSRVAKSLSKVEISIKGRIPNSVDKSFNLASWLYFPLRREVKTARYPLVILHPGQIFFLM